MRNDKVPTESQHSLPLHRVLEDEYITLYGPLPNGYPWSFLQSDLKDPVTLVSKFSLGRTKLSGYLKDKFHAYLEEQQREQPQDEAVLQSIVEWNGEKTLSEAAKKYLNGTNLLNDFLNLQLLDQDLYERERFEGIRLKEKTEELAQSHQQGKKLSQINRMLLEEAYPRELKAKLHNYNFDAVSDGSLEETDDAGEAENNDSESAPYRDVHVSTIYSIIHEQHKRRSALCLSGGGIRSATFNLGILQGLARHGLLGEFDYLSTVSGGGYIGSWFSAWTHRHPTAIDGVTDELRQRPNSPLEPEPSEMTHLRTYSNYLSPRTGLLSADTWTLIVIYLRNLFLNWMVFIPLLLAVLMIPRMGVASVLHGRAQWDWLEPWTLLGGTLLALVGIFYAGFYLPREDARRSSQSGFFFFCLTPLIVSCILLTYFWSLYQEGSHWWGWGYLAQQLPGWLRGWTTTQRFMFAATLLIFLGWGLYVATRWNVIRKFIEDAKVQGKDVRWRVALQMIGALLVVIGTGSLTGYLLWWIATTETLRNPAGSFHHARLFACLAAPLLLAVISLGANLMVGFASRKITDADLEWLARFAAWILIVIVVWATMNALVLYGPGLLIRPWREGWKWSDYKSFWAALVTVAGIISGIITIIGGFSSKTPANRSDQNQSMLEKAFRYQLPKLAAPAFLCFLIIVLSTVTNWLLTHFSNWMNGMFPGLPITYYAKISMLGADKPTLPLWLDHDWIIGHSRFDLLLLMTVVMASIGFLMGRFIDTAKFSIHSMYGNRLKRAYLGASRRKREANWFTNFDPADDLQMHELRPALFHEGSFKNVESFIEKLKNGHDYLSREIYEKLSPTTRQLIESNVSRTSASAELRASLAADLNKLLDMGCLYLKEEHEAEVNGRIGQLLKQAHQGESLVLLNRWLLEEAFPDEIERSRPSKPLHIVNMALNLMKGDNLAWQERKAEPFTVSPLHSGNHLLGYRRTRYYGGENGISLGTAFTISGAAASPNMGYMIASPLVSFLMAMFNVRLGWWLGNPGKYGDRTYNLSVPKFAVGPIFSEALSMTDDKSPYVYLSDGGHFDNLGIYEMVLRRCRFIVVTDATNDHHYKFAALGMAIRKIRIDLGVPIEFRDEDFEINIKPPNKTGKYCAIGTIRYSCVDDNAPEDDGTLIYIKTTLSGNEPQDVRHYRQENEDFPQEFIADQFFSESQFESYRMLGSHIIDMLCGEGKDEITLTEFEDRVRAYHKQPAPASTPRA
ncbi:MAG TPA: patatin-like phospholipase family protein [Pyrinomonadaceae bacterium]|jgi:hypothetical protein